jgi:hypothetical protein
VHLHKQLSIIAVIKAANSLVFEELARMLATQAFAVLKQALDASTLKVRVPVKAV